MKEDELKIYDYLNELDSCYNEKIRLNREREETINSRYREVSSENKSRMQQNNDRQFKCYEAAFEFSKNCASKTDDFAAQEKCYSDMMDSIRKMEELSEKEEQMNETKEQELKFEYEREKNQRIYAEQEYIAYKKREIAYKFIENIVIPIGVELIKKYGPRFLAYCRKKLSY